MDDMAREKDRAVSREDGLLIGLVVVFLAHVIAFALLWGVIL